ncbi:MAG: tRNA (adenosine(37)-N6)-threonylcarbamoyltransferase complex ATPase subunit type 1 TsaE [Rhodobacteraceae bacterium]|nr:tRNA (adenosine(37)-N6)-threonylcarbamoyltransferase complex ATPase subunit type 1 TsaE [Paracoccaceae bacterium]
MTLLPALVLPLPDAEATARLGQTLAPMLQPGDVLLLEGPIGAGKTHFARALIQTRQDAAGVPREDVPSPSFTLVQTYVAGETDIWHADLFRLSLPHEADELGLTDAFDTAICLVEWPERLGPDAPASALHLRFAYAGEGRSATLAAQGTRWAPVLDALGQAFARGAG